MIVTSSDVLKVRVSKSDTAVLAVDTTTLLLSLALATTAKLPALTTSSEGSSASLAHAAGHPDFHNSHANATNGSSQSVSLALDPSLHSLLINISITYYLSHIM